MLLKFIIYDNMQSEIRRMKNIFDNNNIPVSIEWLEECISWCKREILGANYTVDQLKDATHEQWLLLDLRDIQSPVLPTGLSEKKYMVLNGNFSLQVMQVVDISKPKYWQLQQIRKENILTRPSRFEANDSVGAGKRVLQLTLTDGIQYVEAMEYKSVTLLNINLTPGIKVRLSGPITIRRGRLLLEEKNIRILGGEVESLFVSNAAENILAKALNLAENSNPQNVDVNLLTVDQVDENPQQVPNTRNPQDYIESSDIRSRNILNNYNSENRTTLDTKTLQHRTSCSTAATSTLLIEDYPTEEDFEMLMQAENLLEKNENTNSSRNQHISSKESNNTSNKISYPYDEKIELLMEIEQELDNNKKSNKRNKTPDLFEDDFNPDQIDDILKMTNKTENQILKNDIAENTSVQKKNSASLESSSKKLSIHTEIQPAPNLKANNTKANLFDEFINEDDLFSKLDFDELESTKMPENALNIISITKLLHHVKHTSGGSFKVHAKFKSIVEKLTLEKMEYKLTIMVQDESNESICRVHSDVVSKWAGLTPAEVMNLKTSIFSQDVESKKKVEKALQNIKDRLIDINHVMEIQMNGKDSVPTITNIFY